MKTEDKLLLGAGIVGLAGIAYALKKREESYPPIDYKWCAKENRSIPESEWTTARCVAGPPLPPPEPEWIRDGETLQVEITEPYNGDYWWKFFGERTISVNVTNPYPIPKKFYIYVKLFSFRADNSYEYDEYTVITLNPGETKEVKHMQLNLSTWRDDDYYVLAAIRREKVAVNYGQDMNKVTIGTSPIRL